MALDEEGEEGQDPSGNATADDAHKQNGEFAVEIGRGFEHREQHADSPAAGHCEQ